jgi:hypothetical protein
VAISFIATLYILNNIKRKEIIMSKLTNKDNLEKLAQALDARSKAFVKSSVAEESARAQGIEADLQEQIEETQDMFGGKAIRYITQAEYNQLTDEQKNDPTVVYFIIDAEDLSHTHANKELLDKFGSRTLTVGNKGKTFDGSANVSWTLAEIGAAPSSHDHDGRYFTESEINTKVTSLQAEIDADVKVEADRAKAAEAALQAAIEGKAGSVHNHDDRYFTETEINKIVTDLQAEIDADVLVEKNRAENAEIYIQTLLEGKAPSVHSHDDKYYTKSAIDTKVADLQDEIDADVKVVADELTDVNTTLTGYIGEAFGVLDEHQRRLNNHNATIENHTSRINTIQGDGVGSIKYTVNEAVKKEEDRAKAAEVALQANIDKKADVSHGNHVPATQTASNKVFLRNDNTWATITPANIGAAASSHAHDDKYYTETEIDAKITTLNNAINDKAPSTHNHDNIYFTETEINAIISDLQEEIDADVLVETNRAKNAEAALQSAINGKANSSHNHDDRYYTETEINNTLANFESAINEAFGELEDAYEAADIALQTAIDGKSPLGHSHDDRYFTETEVTNKLAEKSDVGHDHADLYYDKDEMNTRFTNMGNAFNGMANSLANKADKVHTHDDRYYTETEIDGKVEDIIDSIDTEVARAKAAESTLQANIDKKANTGHTHDDRYFTETEINNKLAGYSATGHNHDDKYYTETEIDAKVTTLQSNIDGKANKSHGNHVPTVETANNARFLRNDNTWQTITPSNIGAAAYSHGTHVNYASAVPLANGTAAIGSSGKVAREDHVHPLQTEVSGNAGSADVLSTPRNITIGNQTNAFDGSENITYTLSAIGASAEGHNHDGRYYTESEINTKVSSLQSEIDADVKVEADRAKAAENALQANIDKKSDSDHTHTNFAIKLNGGTTEGTNLFTYNGGTAKTVNITPAGIGASATSHTHDDRYFTETEMNAKITTINNSIATAKSDAQKYADNKIAALVGSAPEALNTLQELSKAITDHEDVYDAYVVEMDSKLASKSDTGHTHNYAGSSSAGGAATSANKVNQNLVVKLNGGATEGTNLFTFNGSAAKTINITYENIGAAKASHGTHVNYSTATPKANGTASVGTLGEVARADHIHPLQTTVSGNAGSADKLSTGRTITIGNKSNTFDGTANITYTLADIGAATSGHNHDSTYSKTGHTHNYAGSSSAGGVATSAAKLATPVTLTIGAKGKTFDGSANQSWSLSEIGAAAASHNHTSLTGITSLAFATESSDAGSISTTIDSSNTYFDFNLKDDATQNDMWRWRFTPSGGTVFNAMTLDPTSTTAAKLTVAGEVTATSFTENGTALSNKYAAKSHGTHVGDAYATVAPKANGTADIGTSSRIAREDHVHPLQTTISGNAATASKWQTARTLTIGNAGKSVDGSANVSWSLTEIGAMPLTTITETLDLNNSKTTGVYNLKGSSYTNAPATGNATLFVNFDVGTPYQMFMHDATFKLYYRSYNKTDAVWNAWTSTLGNSISGNAGTATKLSSARTINGTSFDGSANITTANWGTARNISISDNDGTNTGTAVSVNGSGNATLKLPATIKASLTGNASTATKLADTKTINGTAFDGSSNITTANWGTSRNLQIGNSSKAVNGSAGVSWSLAEIGASPLQKSIVSRTVSSGTLTLSTDRYQYATLSNGNTIALPSVSNFTEINLFVKDCNLSTIKLPNNCKWRVDPNLDSGTSFMFKFIYTTQEWLAEVNIYS